MGELFVLQPRISAEPLKPGISYKVLEDVRSLPSSHVETPVAQAHHTPYVFQVSFKEPRHAVAVVRVARGSKRHSLLADLAQEEESKWGPCFPRCSAVSSFD